MAKKKVFKNTLSFNIILATMLLLFTFGIIVAAIGYTKFNDMLLDRYNSEAVTTATSSLHLVNEDHIEAYLLNADKITGKTPIGEDENDIKALKEEFDKTNALLQKFCESEDVAILYFIIPDRDNYSVYYSIFNCPNSKHVPYSAWVLGTRQEHKQPNEYDAIYKDIMEGKKEVATVMRKTKENGALPHINSLVAVKDSTGKVVGIVTVQHTMGLLTKWGTAYTLLIVITTLALSVVSVFCYILLVRKQFITPIQTIINEAQRFSKENSEPDVPIDGDISKIYEISALGEAVGQMEFDTLKYIQNLSQAIADKQKIAAELDIARQIQSAMMPRKFPAFPNRHDFDLYASMTPAKAVGGDFYDYFLIDDDHLGMVIADVSGKGVPAALFMMVSKILIKERALLGGTPAETLEFVNDRICSNNEADLFVTVWFGILELSTGKIIAANAGHDNPAVMRNGRFDYIKSKRGIVVGAMSDAKYTNFEFKLEKKDKIFLFTDGVPEATDTDKNMFTLDRTLETLNAHAEEDPKSIVDAINELLDKFVGDAPQFDDITMLCVEFKGKTNENERIMTIGANIDNLPIVNDFIADFLKEKGATKKDTNQLLVAIEEVFANVAHYAYPPQEGKVKISLLLDGKKLYVTFADRGTPYNPLESADPDVSLGAEERREGGLGIYITKKLVDDVKYEHVDGQNILILEKTL